MPSSKVYAALIVTMLVWGLSFIGTKIALTSFAPFAVMFLRFGLASLLFLGFFLKNGFPRLTPTQHLRLLLLSIFEPGLYFVLETYGIKLTSASETSLLIALVPVAVTVLSRIMLKERLSVRGGTGILLSVAGVAVLVLGGGRDLGEGSSLLGDLLILGAVFSAALYMVLARDLGKKISSLGFTGYQCFYGALFFAPFFLFGAGAGGMSAAFKLEAAAAILFLALGATIGGFVCYNYALSKVPATKASVFINGIPVVTAVGAWFLLGERLTGLQIAGAALVIAAVSLTASGAEAVPKQPELV